MGKTALSALLALADIWKGTEIQCYEGSDAAHQHVVIYHSYCADGFGAAWSIHTAAKAGVLGNAEVLYVPVGYGDRDKLLDALDTALSGFKFIFHIVDFSFLPDQFDRLVPFIDNLTYLDHHQGAEPSLLHARDVMSKAVVAQHVRFDNTRSGARMAWEHYMAEDAPAMIKHIEDRDLWKFELDGTKELCAAAYSYPMELGVWDLFAQQFVHETISEGKAILRQHDKNVAQLCEPHNVRFADFLGHKVAVVNCPWFVVSDVCHTLLEKHPHIEAAAGFYIQNGGDQKWSFRAHKGGLFLPGLLQVFGGGGHQAASGVDLKNLSPEMVNFYNALTWEQ